MTLGVRVSALALGGTSASTYWRPIGAVETRITLQHDMSLYATPNAGQIVWDFLRSLGLVTTDTLDATSATLSVAMAS